MAVDELIEELQLLRRPVGETERQEFLRQLRAMPVEGVDKNRNNTHWDFGKYFHSLQDAYFVVAFDDAMSADVAVMQACFLKDLEWYLSALPEGHDSVRAVFELIRDVGVSSRWETDLELPKAIYRIYDRFDELFLGPWAEQQKNLTG